MRQVSTPAERPLHRLFLWLAPLLYIAFALLTPPFQTPDEHQHLFRAWQLADGTLFAERRGAEVGGVVPGGLGKAAQAEIGSLAPHASHVRPLPERSWTSHRSTQAEAEAPRFTNFLGSAIYPPAGYLPQIVAVGAGRLTGASVETIIRTGRVLNALLAAMLIAMAIRLTPWGATGLFWIGLLPTTSAASATFGQDGLVIGGSCLLLALGLRMALARSWSVSSAALLGLVASFVTLAKFVYLPLAMVAGAPRVAGQWRWRGLGGALFVAAVAVLPAILWLTATAEIAVPPRPDLPPAGTRLLALFEAPGSLPQLLFNTFFAHGDKLWHSAFMFGWLNIGPVLAAEVLSLLALAAVLAGGAPASAGQTLDPWLRLWVAAMAVGVAVAVSLALYVYWTPLGATRIHGLQGRYFVPPAAALLLAVLPARGVLPRARAYVPLLLVGANITVLVTIAATFYRV